MNGAAGEREGGVVTSDDRSVRDAAPRRSPAAVPASGPPDPGRLTFSAGAVPPYLVAVGAVGAAAALRAWVLQPWLGDRPLYILFVLPVIVAAWRGGLGPGLLATVLGMLTVGIFAVSAGTGPGLVEPPRLIAMSVFLLTGAAVSVICHKLRATVGSLAAHERVLAGSHELLERRVAERTEALSRANAQLHGILESSGDLIAANDRDFRFTVFNANYARAVNHALGVDLRVGMSLDEVFAGDPQTRERVRGFWARAMDGEAFTIVEEFGRGDDAEVYEISYNPIRDVDGRVAGAARVSRDVTERQRRRRELERLVTERTAELRLITDALPSLIAHVGRDLRYRSCNRAYADWVGRDQGEIVGLSVAEVMGDAHLERVRPHVAAVLAGGPQRFEAELHSPIGAATITGDISYVPATGAGGSADGFYVLVHDVTARTRAETELRRAMAAAERAAREAQDASRAKDEFLATLSHELRTPLTPVLMTAQALEQDPSLPAALRDDMELIRRNVELEARLIDDLLDLTRVTRGKLELHHEVLDLHDVLRHALDTCCDDQFERKGLTLELDLSARRHLVWGDSARLAQVFWNLLKNAVKFTPAGGRISVRTRDGEDGGADVEPPAGAIAVEVSDTGVGIEPDVLRQIFTAFEQGGSAVTRRFGGLGLGLAISRALVEMHDGTITAASDGRDCGATFTVTLPVMADAPEREPTAHPAASSPSRGPERASVPSGVPATAPARILLVEDHESTARVLSRLLQSVGHDVRWVNSAAAAREAVAGAQDGSAFDLVISDLGLPDGHGHELMRQLRDEHGLRGIALSGYGMEQDIARSRESGFVEHLTKPVNFARLRSVIAEVANR